MCRTRWPSASGGPCATASAGRGRGRARWLLGLVLAYARRLAPNAFVRPAVRAAGLGYALPGTVLALGPADPAGGSRQPRRRAAARPVGVSTGLLLSGSLFVIVLAYAIRFLAVSLGALEAGFERLSPNLDAAARTLGETPLSALWRVHMPLLLPALGAAALLVFVDAMKELPATLLLRPFNFETLATHVYSYAALEQFEQAALGRADHRRSSAWCRCCCCTRRWPADGRVRAVSAALESDASSLVPLHASDVGSSASWAWPIAWRSLGRACRSRDDLLRIHGLDRAELAREIARVLD